MRTRRSILAVGGLLCLAACVAVVPAAAQLTTPVSSPYATLSEQVGITDITIKYNRPGVKGRTIWGEGNVVPYGLSAPFPGFGSGNPFPWRAGANENTTISFEHDVLVEGQPLAAGTYGLHMIPGEAEWVVIFSHNTSSWGSFFYDEAEDALRVTVTPEAAPFKERLVYEFMDQDEQGGATIALLWEALKVPVRVEVDNYHEVVMASMRDELRSSVGFNWQGWSAAANYSLRNDVDLEQGLAWADQAIQRNKSFSTLRLKSALLAKLDDAAASEEMMEEAIAISTENELNSYGYQLLGQGNTDEALRIFKLNVERHPEAWNPQDSLGECYAKVGDTKNARKHYRKALAMLPEGDPANHERITKILGDLDAQGSN